MRAATATALGAAAAHAKLLADQEEREVEYQVSTLVEAQVSLWFRTSFGEKKRKNERSLFGKK